MTLYKNGTAPSSKPQVLLNEKLKEIYGKSNNGWMNKVYWGDNLQIMSHMLRDYRGKIDLIYIDPPFASGADYKKHIEEQA